uniref:Uncharacterized protein n=1 Tax=Brassica oleracea var. oleracea TaxID=109376 RepID=A0A0D3BAT2_BRAOL
MVLESDLLLLGRATIEESRSLLIHWLDTEEGFGKMGVCGRVVWHGSAWEAPREELEAQKITMILDQVREREREREREDVNYSLPHFTDERNPEAVIFVAATDDGYITKHSAWFRSEMGQVDTFPPLFCTMMSFAGR